MFEQAKTPDRHEHGYRDLEEELVEVMQGSEIVDDAKEEYRESRRYQDREKDPVDRVPGKQEQEHYHEREHDGTRDGNPADVRYLLPAVATVRFLGYTPAYRHPYGHGGEDQPQDQRRGERDDIFQRRHGAASSIRDRVTG